jgi:hypothetical protein
MLTDVRSDCRADITAIQELRWVGNAVMQKRDYDITRAAMTVDIYLGWDLL